VTAVQKETMSVLTVKSWRASVLDMVRKSELMDETNVTDISVYLMVKEFAVMINSFVSSIQMRRGTFQNITCSDSVLHLVVSSGR
jgi:hypothetical protein